MKQHLNTILLTPDVDDDGDDDNDNDDYDQTIIFQQWTTVFPIRINKSDIGH